MGEGGASRCTTRGRGDGAAAWLAACAATCMQRKAAAWQGACSTGPFSPNAAVASKLLQHAAPGPAIQRHGSSGSNARPTHETRNSNNPRHSQRGLPCSGCPSAATHKPMQPCKPTQHCSHAAGRRTSLLAPGSSRRFARSCAQRTRALLWPRATAAMPHSSVHSPFRAPAGAAARPARGQLPPAAAFGPVSRPLGLDRRTGPGRLDPGRRSADGAPPQAPGPALGPHALPASISASRRATIDSLPRLQQRHGPGARAGERPFPGSGRPQPQRGGPTAAARRWAQGQQGITWPARELLTHSEPPVDRRPEAPSPASDSSSPPCGGSEGSGAGSG
jgi:hypothetical protein